MLHPSYMLDLYLEVLYFPYEVCNKLFKKDQNLLYTLFGRKTEPTPFFILSHKQKHPLKGDLYAYTNICKRKL